MTFRRVFAARFSSARRFAQIFVKTFGLSAAAATSCRTET